MNLSNREFNWLIIFAFRYALGRRSMAPSVVSDFVKKNYDELTEMTNL